MLEIAHGELSHVLETIQPTTAMRIAQALRRHPDLRSLLEPAQAEIKEIAECVLVARTEVRTAIALVWKFDEKDSTRG